VYSRSSLFFWRNNSVNSDIYIVVVSSEIINPLFAMYNIPVELLLGIVDCVEDSSLPNLRLVSKTLDTVTAPLVFCMLAVRDNVQSAERLGCFQNGEVTTNAVQEIVFQGNPQGSARRLAPPPQWRDEDISDGAGRDALYVAFSGLAKF
jgi:hypothetical protein